MTPAEAGLITPSGTASIPAGMETPDAIELRKRIEESMESGGGDTPALYQVRNKGATVPTMLVLPKITSDMILFIVYVDLDICVWVFDFCNDSDPGYSYG